MAEYEAASLSIADIQAAVNLCSAGDTVVLPADDYYDFGNGTVDFPNNVSLRGQGVASTIIHRDSVWESPMFRWNDSYTDSTHTVEISDFTLYGNDEVTMWGINIRRSVVDFKIHDLDIYECGYCGIGIEGSLSQGVIYNCNFTDCYLSGHGYGVRIDADDIGGEDHYGDNSWDLPLDWNDDYWIFIEDCYFDHCRHATSACWGARYVIRHCEIINGIRDTCIDGHGYTDGSYRSTRAMQVYENIIWHNDTYEPDGIVAHGGDCLGWNNQFVGDWDSGATIYITVNNCDTSYPHVDQSMDSHYWGNSRNGVPFTELDAYFENECPYLLQEERNYWLEAPDGYVPYHYPHPLREGVAGAIAGVSTVSGTLTRTLALGAGVASVSALTAGLTPQVCLAASVTGASVFAGKLLGENPMAIFYVDTNADPGGDGTTTATTGAHCAWDTIADVNGASFSAGDSVLFNRGCTWREQLTVPSSGSVGSPITFGAYGTGDDPIIDGADLITPGTSWDALPAWNTVDIYTPITSATAIYQTRHVVAADLIATNGTKIRITLKAHATSTTVYDHVSIGLATTGSTFDATPTEVLFSGNPSVSIGAGGTAVSDETTFSYDCTKRYLIHVYSVGQGAGYYRIYAENGSGAGFYLDWSTSADRTMETTISVNQTVASPACGPVLVLEVLGTSTVKWAAAVTTEPRVVLFDGTVGNKQASLGAVDSENDWYWASNALNVYSATDPDTAYTSPGIEAGARDYGITGVSKDYITIPGFKIINTNSDGIFDDQGDSWIIDSNNVEHCYVNGIRVRGNPSGAGSITGIEISNNTIGKLDTNAPIVSIDSGGIVCKGTSGALVHGNTIATVRAAGITFDVGGGSGVGAASLNPDIYQNTITSNEIGIYLVVTTGAEIYKNHIHDGTGTGIALQWFSDNAQVYYNVIHTMGQNTGDTAYNGIDINNNTQAASVYNNIVRNVERMCVTVEGTTAACDDCIIKNNILDASSNGGGGYPVQVNDDITTVTFSNNCYVARSGAPTIIGLWKSVEKNFADWTTASGDSNSMQADPLMTDPDNGDFTLQAGSPCINAGTDVGLTQDYAGNLIFGNPDIGAYETAGGVGGVLSLGISLAI